MAYSTASLSTKADCDLLISLANKEKGDLEYRKISLQRQQTNYTENSVEVASELNAVNAELSALDTIITSLPDGATKDDQITKKKKAELKQYLLTQKQEDYGSIALLTKEFELARIQTELDEATVFITALETRKVAIV